MLAGLGRAELEFVASLTVPLFWVERQPSGDFRVRNGSAFFLDTGERLFGVTAAHVIREMEAARARRNIVALNLGGTIQFDPDNRHRQIAIDDEIDIATFQVGVDEITALEKVALTGYQRRWPPSPPQTGRGVYYCGFPGRNTLWMARDEISFGCVPAGGVASSVSELDVSTQIERDYILDVMGLGLPPENFDFGGMSGGPMLSVVERNGLRSWQLAGVIYQGPNTEIGEDAITGLEVIRARRAHFIMPDGSLDLPGWASANIGRR